MSHSDNGPLDIVDQHHRVRRVHVAGDDDTIGGLAVALGLPYGPLTIDGTVESPATRLSDARLLRTGASVKPGDASLTARDDTSGGRPVVEVAAVAGPDCGRWRPVTAGRHRLGRAADATVSIADPTIEPYVGLLEIADDGSADFVQLSGMAPVEVRAHPTAPDVQVIRLGSSTVHVRAVRTEREERTPSLGEVDRAAGSWGRVVRRATTPAPTTIPPVPDAPPGLEPRRRTPATGLIAAAMSLAGAAVGVVVFGSMLFAVFAGLAATASIGTWTIGAMGSRRDYRRRGQAVAAAEEEFVAGVAEYVRGVADQMRTGNPALADTLALIDDLREGATRSPVWSDPRGAPDGCRPADDERDARCWPLLVGRGDVAITAAALHGVADHVAARVVDATTAIDVPITVELRLGEALAIHGTAEAAADLARAMLIDLAARHGPAHVRIDTTMCAATWTWAQWLPHHVSVEVDSTPAESARIVIVDDPNVLMERDSALRRALDAQDVAVIVLVPTERAVPSRCLTTVTVGALGGIAIAGARTDVGRASMAGLTLQSAEAAARTLAPLIDPEDVAAANSTPSVVDLDEIDDALATDADEPAALAELIGDRWAVPTPTAACLGRAGGGNVELSLARHGPHVLIGGTTGAGKSELLRTLIASIATRHPPSDVAFVLIDYKGGAAFDACAAFPHVVGMVTDLDDGIIDRALAGLRHELREREERLRRAGVGDTFAYRQQGAGDGPMPDLVVVVDEFATLAADRPHLLGTLVAVAQRGRSLGLHLVLATQRPAGAIGDDVRANTDIRIALRTQTAADSLDIVDDRRGAQLPRSAPGRALVRLGHDELVEVQTARCTGPPARPSTSLRVETLAAPRRQPPAAACRVAGERLIDVLVAATRRVMERDERARLPPLWIDPLPPKLSSSDLAAHLGGCSDVDTEVVGLIDDDGHRRRLPLRWDPQTGGLALVGSPGAGVSTAMQTLLLAAAAASSPASLHIYVIDMLGDAALAALSDLPHCAGLVRRNETERIARTLARLRSEIDRRGSGGLHDQPLLICAIDGYGALRRALADEPQLTADLTAVVEDGSAVGVMALVGDDGTSPAVLNLPVADRWFFHLDAVVADRVRGDPVPPGLPGRLRVESSGLLAHVARSPDGADIRTSLGDGPVPVEVLPARIELRDTAIGMVSPEGGVELPVGVDADTLLPATLTLPHGDHALIVGGTGGGRTTTLRTVVDRWRHVTGGRVVDIGRRHPSDEIECARAAGESGEAVLLVIDDAERVDDASGALAAIANGRDGANLTIVAAARLDAVRASYGHWTRDVARSRCGVVMSAPGDVDGDLFGCTLPRRSIVAPRPGLGWIIDRRGQRLAQIAAKLPP